MCRDKAHGGRRCPSNSDAGRDERNTRRRWWRLGKKQIVARLEDVDPGLADQIRSLPPTEAAALAAKHNVPMVLADTFTPARKSRARVLPANGRTRRAWRDANGDYVNTAAEQRSAAIASQYQQWSDSLTDEERHAVSQYSTHNYQLINDRVRTGDPSAGGLIDPTTWTVKHLDDALDRARARTDRPLYRVVGIKDENGNEPPVDVDVDEWVNRRFHVGEQYEMPAYTSTSHDPGFLSDHKAGPALADKNRNRYAMEIVTNRGAYIGDSSVFKAGEEEHLLPRNSRFEVIRVGTQTYQDRLSGQPYDMVVVTMIDVTDPDEVAARHHTDHTNMGVL